MQTIRIYLINKALKDGQILRKKKTYIKSMYNKLIQHTSIQQININKIINDKDIFLIFNLYITSNVLQNKVINPNYNK